MSMTCQKMSALLLFEPLHQRLHSVHCAWRGTGSSGLSKEMVCNHPGGGGGGGGSGWGGGEFVDLGAFEEGDSRVGLDGGDFVLVLLVLFLFLVFCCSILYMFLYIININIK